MHRWIIAAAVAAVAAAGCKRGESDAATERPTPQRQRLADAGDKKGTPMTSSSDPWEQAKAIAAAQLPGKTLKKRTDELPYYFYARGVRGILVHHGKVVTERGVQVAADYLRDIGFVEGPTPSAFQALHVLQFLEALPKIEGFAPDDYYPPPGPNPNAWDKALGARVERKPGEATLVLSYLGESHRSHPGGAPAGPVKRQVTRATLTIGGEGPAKWKLEDVEWTPPPDF